MKSLLTTVFVKSHIFLYRISGGRIGSRLGHIDHLLLTTTGRKSGAKRTIPIACKQEPNSLVIVASNGGQDKHPAWFLNLRDNPTVTVQFGKQKKQTVAHVATADERARLWPELVKYNRMFGSYEKRTAREIPVVILVW